MRVYSHRLLLNSPWTVSHGTSTSRTNVFLEIDEGIGEAPIVPYYEYDSASVTEWLEKNARLIPPDPSEPPRAFLAKLEAGPPPAQSALDMALHDRWGRSTGQPVYVLMGLSPSLLPESSFTLGIPSSDEAFVRALTALGSWPMLKLKLGSGSAEKDLNLVMLARDHFEGRLCVDANGGWELSTATRMLAALADLDILFVEEPLEHPDVEAWANLRSNLPAGTPPIIADESARSEKDVIELAPHVDGVNVKLAKTGGLTGAYKMIRAARAHDLQVLVGCMVESSVGVTAAAHLAPLADYADLDGHLQISNDPFRGVRVELGTIYLPERPGLGLTEPDATS